MLLEFSKLPAKPFHECLTRKSEVDKMWSMYESMKCEKEQHITGIYLTGPPGSGKTQLSRQFGEEFGDNVPEGSEASPVVLTVNVESMKALIKSTKQLLEDLELVKTDIITKDETIVAQFYMDILRKLLKRYSGKWLLIFDNLFDAQDFNGILPQPGCENWGEGKIIVTTQNGDLAPACHAYAKAHSLEGGLAVKDAVTVLTEISGVKEDEFTARVAKEVEYFPLSLACAATYVGQMRRDRPSSNFSWKQFHELYQKHNGELRYRSFETFNVYPHSMAVVAELAVSRLAQHSDVLRHAFNFLSYCTISPVPLTLVSNFVQEFLPSDTESEEIKAEISRCSLLSEASTSVESIKFHQVMGKAFAHFRDEEDAKLQDIEKMERYVSLLHSLVKNLEKAIPDYDHDSVAMKILASQHLKAIVDHGKAQQWTECAEFVIILAFLADCLYHVPGVTEADRISYCELAYEISQRLSKPMESIPYVKLLKTLGFYYRENNDLAKAVSMLEEGLRLAEGKEDMEEWRALKSSLLNVIAWTYKLQTEYDLAEEKMKSSIELAKVSFGDRDQEVIERLCNLAIIYREKQNISKAKETVDKAREMTESIKDKWHLTRAQAANFSAKIYLHCAKMTENAEKKEELLNQSLKLHADALNIYENALGQDHIYVAGVCMTYGSVYKQLKQYGKAHELVKRAEKIYQDVGHSQLSSALRYETEVLLDLGKASEAEEAIKRSIEMNNCGHARFLLSDVYLHQKRFKESKAVINEVLERWKSGVLPPTHFWLKHAEKIKKQCNQEIFKMYMFRLLPLVAIGIAICLAIWYAY